MVKILPYKKSGIWFIKWNFAQTEILGLAYHCFFCENDPINSHLSTYLFISDISERCPICRNPIDFSDLRELDKQYPGLING